MEEPGKGNTKLVIAKRTIQMDSPFQKKNNTLKLRKMRMLSSDKLFGAAARSKIQNRKK
jgi:hypothetical protein